MKKSQLGNNFCIAIAALGTFLVIVSPGLLLLGGAALLSGCKSEQAMECTNMEFERDECMDILSDCQRLRDECRETLKDRQEDLEECNEHVSTLIKAMENTPPAN